MGYSPWGHKELDTTERLSVHTHTHTQKLGDPKFSHLELLSSLENYNVIIIFTVMTLRIKVLANFSFIPIVFQKS